MVNKRLTMAVPKHLNRAITHLMEDGSEESLKTAIERLEQQHRKYIEGKQKKWIFAALGGIVFGVAIYFGGTLTYDLTKNTYDRTELQNLLATDFARFKISDTATDESLLISYAYNSREPRFYSKHYAKNNSYKYDVQVDKALLGASSLILYFDPYDIPLGVGYAEMLVDGAIIAENPSLYSTVLAMELNKNKNLRVVSIGSGISDFSSISFTTGSFI